MGVRIEVGDGFRLILSGGIETVLDVPHRGRVEGFSLAFSDGTLLRGTWASGSDSCRFALTSAGTSRIRISSRGDDDLVDLDGDFDWISLACGADALRPEAINDDGDGAVLSPDIGASEAA